MPNSPTLIFTGGHHTSALAVAITLQRQGWHIIWFGHRYSMWGDTSDSGEYREVMAAKIKFVDLKAGKFHRTTNLRQLILIPVGFIQAFIILRQLKFRLKSDLKGIVSFGGYLAVPVVITGWLLGIPVITHEQTVTAGYANRVIALFAKKIALSWPTSLALYPKTKSFLTGLPLRPEILRIKSSTNNPRADLKTILVIGGKQGAHTLNQVVFTSLPQLITKYRIVHQTGSSSVHADYQQALSLQSPNYTPYDYLFPKEFAAALAQADVVVSRSGAHSVYEYGFLGKRCVLVPIPRSSHQEQMKNAQILVNHGLAILVPQDTLSPRSLLTAIHQAEKLTSAPLSIPADGQEKLIQLIIQTFS